jgi:hypothetical protein
VPNDFWVTYVLPFLDTNVSRGKINITHNCGSDAPRNFDQHEMRIKSKKVKEDAAASTVATTTKKKGMF